jgi:protein tyrosine phosphatase (PTP) superfamily phosphohydrolase (DUF442 family)
VIRHALLIAVASGIVLFTGCRQNCCLNEPGNRPNPYRPSAPNSPFTLPPTGLPTTPAPQGGPFVPGAGQISPQNFPAPDLGPLPSNKPPTEVLLPDPLFGNGPARSGFSNPPGSVYGTPTTPPTGEPPLATNPVTAGLPNFVKVKDGLASGRKPSLDGFEALRQAGYRTVIYLHASGADVSAAKEVAEKRNLKFIAIETTPEKLTDAVALFNTAVTDKSNRPAYVYDDDGVRAGALWYLYFRTAEARNHDEARVRAKPLGLTDEGEEAKAFALAIQRYLETR